MGIDAEMFVQLNYKPSAEEMKHKSYVFGSMFHYDLLLGYDEKIYHHPLEFVDKVEGDGYGPHYEFYASEPEITLINIPLSGRYYGRGYERGPLFTYIAIAEALEILFPNSKIYYGGDSSGTEFIEFNSKNRKDLMIHAMQVAHEPYQKYFSGDHTKYTCPVCEVGMVQNGFKGTLGFFTCSGCGWNVDETPDGIKKGFNLKMEFTK